MKGDVGGITGGLKDKTPKVALLINPLESISELQRLK